MRNADYLKLPDDFPCRNDRETLLSISTSDQGNGCVVPGGYCGSLTAINFDNVKSAWCDQRFFHQVRSCDALYIDGDRYYLIEFKTGKVDAFDLHRKIYDSVLCLVEHSILSIEDCRDKLQYLVVSLARERSLPLQAYLESHMREPWDYDLAPRGVRDLKDRDLRKLTNWLFNKAFYLSPEDFDQFARNRNWSN